MTNSNTKWISSSNIRNRTIVFDVPQEYAEQDYVNISELKINSTYSTIDYKSNYFAFLKKYNSTNWYPYIKSSNNSDSDEIQYLYVLHVIRIPVQLYDTNTEIIDEINKAYSRSIGNILVNIGEIVTSKITNLYDGNTELYTYVHNGNVASKYITDDMFKNYINNINNNSTAKDITYYNTITNYSENEIGISLTHKQTSDSTSIVFSLYNIDKNVNMLNIAYDGNNMYITSNITYINSMLTNNGIMNNGYVTITDTTTIVLDVSDETQFSLYIDKNKITFDARSPYLSFLIATSENTTQSINGFIYSTNLMDLISSDLSNLITNYDSASKKYTFSMDIIPVSIINSQLSNNQHITDEIATEYDCTMYDNSLVYTDKTITVDISTYITNYIHNTFNSAQIFYSRFNHNKIGLAQVLNISQYSVNIDNSTILYNGINPYTPIIGNMFVSYIYTGDNIFVNDVSTDINAVQFVSTLRINTEDSHTYPITLQVCYTYSADVDKIINNTQQMSESNDVIVLSEINLSSENISSTINQSIISINKNVSIGSGGVKIFITGKDIQYPFLKTTGWLRVINV